MNIILFSHDEARQNTVTLSDRRAQHIIKILKAKIGDTLTTGAMNGGQGTSRIAALSKTSVTFTDINHSTIQPRPTVDLVMALPRPIMLKRVLAQIATFGVDHLFLINSNRVEKSFFSSSKLQPEKMHQRLQEGLEQASATALPTISIHTRFKPFVEDTLPQHMAHYNYSGIAHPRGTTPIHGIIPTKAEGKVLLVIGPEGGWVEYEVDKFNKTGIKSFTMGSRILRVDSVVPALLSQVSLLRGM